MRYRAAILLCATAAVETGGVEAPTDANRRKPDPKNRIGEVAESASTVFALEQSVFGQLHVSNGLGTRLFCFTFWRPLYLALDDVEHTRTKVRHPQTNGICERFHKIILQEFYQVAFQRKIYSSIQELQVDVNNWFLDYNNDRTHQGKMCCGLTPMQTCVMGR